MIRKLSILAAVFAVSSTLAPSDAEARPRGHVTVVTAPPPVAPPAARVWVPTQRVWDARANRYVVVPGHWKAPPRTGAIWVPGHWERRGRQQVWVSGHWRF